MTATFSEKKQVLTTKMTLLVLNFEASCCTFAISNGHKNDITQSFAGSSCRNRDEKGNLNQITAPHKSDLLPGIRSVPGD